MTTLEPPEEGRDIQYRGEAVSEVMYRIARATDFEYEISPDVEEYILDEVLVGEEEWIEAQREGRINIPEVKTILSESMDEAMRVASQSERSVIDVDIAREA